MSVASLLKFIARHPLNADQPLSGLARFASWQVRSRLNSRPAVHPWVNGAKLRVRRGETGLTQNVYTGLHEFTDMGFLLHLLRREDFFADIGANSGSYTVLAAGALGCQCVCFEPVSSTFERLLDNISLNNSTSRVRALNVGLGANPGTLKFTAGEDTTNHALAAGEHSRNTIEVPIMTLDDALAGEVPVLLKLDVEGFETPVLDGGERTFSSPNLKAMIIELNGSGARYGYDEEKLVSRFRSLGFTSCRYDPFTRALTPGGTGEYGNTLFVRDFASVQARLRSAPAFKVNGRSI